ncbi:hypothetical protein [Streptomyces sp. NPDC092295]|uniref:hypothetical protein n=1 Tax=Streptomyces sp. NPDC092295 TaxID=3366011 RepID=UPI003818C423
MPLDPTPSDDAPIRTLLWTAATARPLDEVAALVSLLKRTGEVPNPGDEALRAAAVTRPLDEVRHLVALLNEPPHEVDEADTALRAAAVGRSIEDVALLVSILGTEERVVAAPAGLAEARREPEQLDMFAPDAEDAAVRATPAAPFAPLAPAGPATPVGAATPVGPATPAGPAAPAGPLADSIAARPRIEGPGIAAGLAALAGTRSGPHGASPALRSALRWPAAAVLFGCGLIHLPTDFAQLRSGGFADVLSLAITALCLVLGLWLAVQDTTRIWAASAATAVGIIAAHSMSGAGGVDLLQSSLGESFVWAKVTAMACAVLAALVGGSVLMRRQRAAGTANDG